ncbi:MAG: Asp-tRNA(Asn)/Glu-tRNA(Gln) amidotransferase subunit GatA [Puniceicoccales bacterium]|jgi:aspartyl-tRNA(Asn)/glutamyl-tRNA(Gln) amidotransferase subunit A|nr:Asp-tRNA(Asn)/Glu-tRNA(Gln) amidotransferase subunit GatA [Puniceicoccales bacterium]
MMEAEINDGLFYKSAAELEKLLNSGEISSVELTKKMIDRTKAIDGKLNAFISFDEEKTLDEAKESDARRKVGKKLSPIDGIPVGIKDVISECGQPLTCGSKMLEGYIAPYDATVIGRMRDAGCVLWGRINMDEFAMGSSNENSHYGPVANPWDTTRVPGGSSGGSAAAVASGEAVLALGSDTGGSVRQPAAFCGIVGLKPSYGAVSRYGLVAFASSLDQIGQLGRSSEDVATLFQVISGHDENDSSSYNFEKKDYAAEVRNFQRKKTIGVPKEFFGDGLDSEVKSAVEDAISFYENAGHKIKDVHLEMTEYAMAAYYIIATAEASANLARFDGIRYGYRSNAAQNAVDIYYRTRGEGFGAEVKRRIMLGTFVLSSENFESHYLRAQKVRTLIRRDFMRVFDDVDALITPVTPTTAFKIGEKTSDPLQMYLADIYTVPINLAGFCGLSVPCGFSSGGLPIGMQVIGKPFHEHEILALGNEFERAHEFKNMHPAL